MLKICVFCRRVCTFCSVDEGEAAGKSIVPFGNEIIRLSACRFIAAVAAIAAQINDISLYDFHTILPLLRHFIRAKVRERKTGNKI